MTRKELFIGLKRLAIVTSCLLLGWLLCIFAIIGLDHIIYDHMLFGLLK